MRIFFKVFFIMRLLNMLCIRESKKFIPRQSSYFIPMTSAYSLYIYMIWPRIGMLNWNSFCGQMKAKFWKVILTSFFASMTSHDLTFSSSFFLSCFICLLLDGYGSLCVCVYVCARLRVYIRTCMYTKESSFILKQIAASL